MLRDATRVWRTFVSATKTQRTENRHRQGKRGKEEIDTGNTLPLYTLSLSGNTLSLFTDIFGSAQLLSLHGYFRGP